MNAGAELAAGDVALYAHTAVEPNDVACNGGDATVACWDGVQEDRVQATTRTVTLPSPPHVGTVGSGSFSTSGKRQHGRPLPVQGR